MSTEATTVTIGSATTVTVAAGTGPRGPAGAGVPTVAAWYPLDSGTLTFAATGGWADFVVGGTDGMRATTVWFRPPDRAAAAGDIIRIQPRFAVTTDASTDAPLYFRAVTRNQETGAVLRVCGQGGSFGVAGWRVRPGDEVGASEVKIDSPLYHRVRADEIGEAGAVVIDIQVFASHTAGTYSMVETAGFGANDPAQLIVDGPHQPIRGTGLVFTGQSLANNVGNGQHDDIYPRRVVKSLVDAGYTIGYQHTNWSGTTYNQRDNWHLLLAGALLRYERVLAIDDGGSSDLIAGQSAASLLTEMEAFADSCRGVADSGVVKFARITIPDTNLLDAAAQTERGTLNTSLLANANAKFDAVIDLVAADADFDDDTSALFHDNTHFTIAGHTAAAAAVVDGITSLLLT